MFWCFGCGAATDVGRKKLGERGRVECSATWGSLKQHASLQSGEAGSLATKMLFVCQRDAAVPGHCGIEPTFQPKVCGIKSNHADIDQRAAQREVTCLQAASSFGTEHK